MTQPTETRGRDRFLANQVAILFGLLASLPFIFPLHLPPWYTYHPELAAALLIVGIAGYLLLLPRPTRIASTTLWFGAFAAALVVQTAVVQPGYWGPALTAAGTLAVCAFLSQAVLQARSRWSTEQVLLVLCIGLVGGGLISGAVGWIQRLDQTSHFPYLVLVHPVDPRQALGNIGQRNLYGHYMMWASIASVYLFARGRRYWVPLGLLMTWMAFEAALAESRTTMGYYAIWLTVALIGLFYRSDTLQRRFALASLWAIAVGVLTQFVGPLIVREIAATLGEPIQARAGLDRFADQGVGLGRRVAEWQKAWMVFLEHPWFGVGFGYYAGQSFQLHSLPQFSGFREDVLWTHCHNSVLQILAEIGLVGAGFLLALGVMLIRALRQWQSGVTVVVLPLVGVSLMHSLMEYPLWYLHFLALFAVYLTLLEPVCGSRPQALGYRLPLWATAATLVVLHPVVFAWILNGRQSADPQQERQRLEQAARVPLFDHVAENSIARLGTSGGATWGQLDGLTARLQAYRPFPDANFWRMCALGAKGQPDALRALFMQSQIAYPGYAFGNARDLRRYHCVPASVNTFSWLKEPAGAH